MNPRPKTAKAPPNRMLYHVYHKLNLLREIITQGSYPNASALAARMEVSPRTVKRYLDYLREQNAPLKNDRRKGGLLFYRPVLAIAADAVIRN